jgi:hypothetical protein
MEKCLDRPAKRETMGRVVGDNVRSEENNKRCVRKIRGTGRITN